MSRYLKITVLITLVCSLFVTTFQEMQAAVNPKDMTNAAYRMAPILEELAKINESEVSKSLERFFDMSDHWSRLYVGALTKTGIVTGYPDSTFKPDCNLNVDEFITLAVKSIGYKLTNGENYWAEPFIDTAKKEKLITDGQFETYDRPILREEMVHLLVNMVSLYDELPSIDEEMVKRIECDVIDIHDVGGPFKQSVLTSYRMGIITGNPDGTFAPKSKLTRAEATTVLLRALDKNRRSTYVPRTDRGIIVKNEYTLEDYMIRPRGVPSEVIEASYFLREAVKKTEGFSIEGTSGVYANTVFDIAESKKYYEAGILDIGFSITCQVTEGMLSVKNGWPLYKIGIWEKEKFSINNNLEILNSYLDFLFGSDSYIAKELVQKYIEMPWRPWNPGEGVQDETVINGRYFRINTGSGIAHGFGIIVGTKEF